MRRFCRLVVGSALGGDLGPLCAAIVGAGVAAHQTVVLEPADEAWQHALAEVHLLGEGSVRTRGVVLGERPSETPETVPVAARWITADAAGGDHLIYAADPALKRLQVRVGSKPVDTDGFLGY